MADDAVAAPAPRKPKVKPPVPRKQTASEVLGGLILVFLGGLLALAGAVLVLPFSAGFLLAWTLPRRGLPALVGPLLCLSLAALLSTKFGLDTLDAQKGAFLGLVAGQKGWFLANWPKYVTGGPFAVDFGGIPAEWSYFVLAGLPAGAVARRLGLSGLLFRTQAPEPSSAPSPSAVSPPSGGKGEPDEATDAGTEATRLYTVAYDALGHLFTRREQRDYTVQEALRRARSSRWQRIRYWCGFYGIFRRIPPHLLPCNRVKGGIDRVFGQVYTRLWLSLPGKLHGNDTRLPCNVHGNTHGYQVGGVHGNAHPTDTRLPGRNTRERAVSPWHTDVHAYRVLGITGAPSQYTPTVYTWGDTGQVGSVELLVSPAKTGKTKLTAGLTRAQRTGTPFLGRPTVRTGAVHLVEESRQLFDPKRREMMALPPAPEHVNPHLFRHRVSTSINVSRLNGQGLPPIHVPTAPQTPASIDQRRETGLFRRWLPTAQRVLGFLEHLSSAFVLQHSISGFVAPYGTRPIRNTSSPRTHSWSQDAPSLLGPLRAVQRGALALYRISRKWLPAHDAGPGFPPGFTLQGTPGATAKHTSAGHRNPRKTSVARNDGPPRLLEILYGPETERSLLALVGHLAVAVTVCRVRSLLTGIPWYVIQVDSLFHWVPEAEQDTTRAMAAMQVFKAVASLGFLVRVVVHSKDGKVAGSQNTVRQADFLLWLTPVPKSADPKTTNRRRLSAEGRFEDRERPDDLDYALEGHTLVAPENGLSAQSDGKPAPKHDLPDTAGRAGATTEAEDGPAHDPDGEPQNGHPGGSQGIPEKTPGVSKEQARITAENLAFMLSLCPEPDQQPAKAADIVKTYCQARGVKKDRAYSMGRQLAEKGKLEISFVPGKTAHQWRQSRPK